MEQPVPKVIQGQSEPRALWVLRVQLVPQAFKALQVQRVQRVQLAQMEQPVPKVIQGQWALRALQVQRAPQV